MLCFNFHNTLKYKYIFTYRLNDGPQGVGQVRIRYLYTSYHCVKPVLNSLLQCLYYNNINHIHPGMMPLSYNNKTGIIYQYKPGGT